MKLKLTLLTSMLFTGLANALLYHYFIMPLFESEFIHCITSGLIFGLISYFISIIIYKSFNKLKEFNNIDKLTSLYNRRAFENDLLKISNNNTYSIIFIDIDNFRKFSNELSQKSGDIVLQKVSETIRKNISSDDKTYRYGEKEIVILLKDCRKSTALEIAEKLRINISMVDNAPQPSITVSLGVANYPEDDNSFSNVIVAGEIALWTAKRSGKNCTISYNSVLV